MFDIIYFVVNYFLFRKLTNKAGRARAGTHKRRLVRSERG